MLMARREARTSKGTAAAFFVSTAKNRSAGNGNVMGIKSNTTLLYGHRETIPDRVNHMIQLRELQDETGGFQVFIPLAFHPENTEMSEIPKPSGVHFSTMSSMTDQLN